MRKPLFVSISAAVLFTLILAGCSTAPPPAPKQEAAKPAEPPKPKLPSDGYTVHVTAPHLVDGKEHGPYHHLCKVIGDGPMIQCLIYDTMEPNAPLTQVEWIYAKKMTREKVALKDWNKNWHDHAIEIAGGRVQVHDMPPDKAKEVADLVATTDGMIYHFYYDGGLPNGKMSIAQAVGHKPMTSEEHKKY